MSKCVALAGMQDMSHPIVTEACELVRPIMKGLEQMMKCQTEIKPASQREPLVATDMGSYVFET